VLPFLNAALGGFEYLKEPPAEIFRTQGKFITVHAREISINALGNEAEGVKTATDCPPLDTEDKKRIENYMHLFNFDV
jgi:hypothetical protein